MANRLAAPICRIKQWVFNRIRVKEVRNMARKKDKENFFIYRETGSLLSRLYKGALSHSVLT